MNKLKNKVDSLIGFLILVSILYMIPLVYVSYKGYEAPNIWLALAIVSPYIPVMIVLPILYHISDTIKNKMEAGE